jgi:ribokinase
VERAREILSVKGRVCVVGAANADLLITVAPDVFTPGYAVGSSFRTLPGGKGLNTAMNMAALAPHNAGFAGRVGIDFYGEFLADTIADSPLTAFSLVKDSALHTGIGHVRVRPDGEYETVVLPGANAAVGPSDVRAYSASNSDPIGWATNLETPLNWWHEARELHPGTPLAINLSPLNDDVAFALEVADLIVLNQAEARDLTHSAPSQLVTEILTAIRSMTKATIVITAGEAGAEALTSDGQHVVVTAKPATVETTVGAGDAFFATLTLALHLGVGITEAMELAAEAGSIVASSTENFLTIQTGQKLAKKLTYYTSPAEIR